MVIVGVDEVGRGCLAGPMVVGAVILSQPIAGLKDSKLLTKIQRKRLLSEIKLWSEGYGLGWVSAKEIDELGLTSATELAITRAVAEITVSYDEIIIDGNINYLSSNPKARSLIKADNLVPAVSAASVLAKCARDDYMNEQAINFPHYGFDKHVGYGTKYHMEQLKAYGVSELHRLSFKPLNEMSGIK